MARRIIQDRRGLPVLTSRQLSTADSKETCALITSEAISLPNTRTRNRTVRWVWILAAIVTFVIAIQANAINLKNALIGGAVAITLLPVLRRLSNR